jgi:hypothetical protein
MHFAVIKENFLRNSTYMKLNFIFIMPADLGVRCDLCHLSMFAAHRSYAGTQVVPLAAVGGLGRQRTASQ